LPDELVAKCSEAKLDGQEVNLIGFVEKILKYEMVLVKIECTSSTACNRRENP